MPVQKKTETTRKVDKKEDDNDISLSTEETIILSVNGEAVYEKDVMAGIPPPYLRRLKKPGYTDQDQTFQIYYPSPEAYGR